MKQDQIKAGLEPGDQVPDFTLKDKDGNDVVLSSFRGRPVVIYFYPRDETPGCTREACGFRDNFEAITDTGAEILGISPDDASSHTKFATKHELPFRLLSDPDHGAMEAYGAWGLKKRFGKESFGVIRSTFIVDKNGLLFKLWKSVKVDGHAEKVLAQVEKLVSESV